MLMPLSLLFLIVVIRLCNGENDFAGNSFLCYVGCHGPERTPSLRGSAFLVLPGGL